MRDAGERPLEASRRDDYQEGKKKTKINNKTEVIGQGMRGRNLKEEE